MKTTNQIANKTGGTPLYSGLLFKGSVIKVGSAMRRSARKVERKKTGTRGKGKDLHHPRVVGKETGRSVPNESKTIGPFPMVSVQ